MSKKLKMRISFAGCHRVGKTTLAKHVSVDSGLPFIPLHITKAPVWREAHIQPGDYITFSERVNVQVKIMKFMANVMKGNPGIYDKSYIDLIGYLYANVDQTCSNLFNDAVTDFISSCLYAQNSHFDKLIVVQPGIKIPRDDIGTSKVYMSQSYMQAMNNNIIATVVGYLDPSKYLIIPANVIDLHERIKLVKNFIGYTSVEAAATEQEADCMPRAPSDLTNDWFEKVWGEVSEPLSKKAFDQLISRVSL